MSVKSFASSTRTSRSTVRSTAFTAKGPTTRRAALSSSIATKSNSTGALPPKGTTTSNSSSRSKAKSTISQSRVTDPVLNSKPIKYYDPVEDLQRHYLEGDEGMRHQLEDDETEMPATTGFLEKSLKYQQLNEKLEKTSKDIYERIDSYIANKTLQNAQRSEQGFLDMNDNALKSSGTGYPSENSKMLSPSDPMSDNSDAEYSSSNSSLSSLSTSLDTKQVKSVASSVPRKNAGKTSKVQNNGDPVDTKTRQRLQKASESVINCLQSKLSSYEGRIADMNTQYRQKIQENTMLESKIKLLEDDREKLLKSNANLQATADKHAKAAETAKSELNLKIQALTTAKKEMEAVKKELRIKSTALQNLQVKVNRLTEDNDRLKHQTRSTQLSMRDKQHEDRSVIDELHQRVNQLEQQKTILNSTISKQTLLIKALRTQRTSNPGQDKPTFY